MEIREFALQLLKSDTLEQKLWAPSSFSDEFPGHPLHSPDAPGRPKSLQFSETTKVSFPTIPDLADPQKRGWVFHFFANHELLAVELMALALLKFPEAPTAFRHGVVHTILEEQSHLKLYQQQMARYGVEFGEIGVNPFFWKCLAPVDQLLSFVCGMNLTLEQANLDYCRYYQKIFEGLGDHTAVQVLERVLQDEIGHVRHGLKWLQRWKLPEQSEWDAYQQNLIFPLTPRRAKGKSFDRSLRLPIGFSEDYLSHLELYSYSKGRSPDVFYFYPTCDEEQMPHTENLKNSKALRSLTHDLECVPLFLAHQEDLLLVRRRPSDRFLRQLLEQGVALPEFFVLPDESKPSNLLKTLQHRKFRTFQPWGWCPALEKMFSPLWSSASPSQTVLLKKFFDEQPAALFSKTSDLQLLKKIILASPQDSDWMCPLSAVGEPCQSLDEILEQASLLEHQGYLQVVFKAPFGTSGRNQRRYPLPLNLKLLAPDMDWIRSIFKNQEVLILEPWLDKVFDFSFQMVTYPSSPFSLVGMNRFFTSSRGKYLGAWLGSFTSGLSSDVCRFLNEDPLNPGQNRLRQRIQTIAEEIAKRCAALSYCGPLGIDAFVYRDPVSGENRIKPIVEINPRYTMGRVALALQKKIEVSASARWSFVHHRQLKALGHSSFSSWIENLQQQYPLRQNPSTGKWTSGCFCTNDPWMSQQVLGVVFIGDALEVHPEPF